MQVFITDLDMTHKGAPPAELVIFNEDASMKDPIATMKLHIQQYERVNQSENISIYEEEWLDDPWIKILIRGMERLRFTFDKIAKQSVKGIASYIQKINEDAQIAIFFANPAIVNPKPILDNAVDIFVNGRAYNAFVDTTKYPYVRIVILGLNNLRFARIRNAETR